MACLYRSKTTLRGNHCEFCYNTAGMNVCTLFTCAAITYFTIECDTYDGHVPS